MEEFGWSGRLEDEQPELAAVRERLAEFREAHPDFAADWDRFLRDAADNACADIAGQRMAGKSHGQHAGLPTSVPVPFLGFDPGDVFQVFGLDLLAEVASRLGKMNESGPGGIG